MHVTLIFARQRGLVLGAKRQEAGAGVKAYYSSSMLSKSPPELGAESATVTTPGAERGANLAHTASQVPYLEVG